MVFGKSKAAQLLKAIMLVALCFIYFFGSVRLNSLHVLFHTHEQVVKHDASDESNECHRAIYHHDTEKGCHHKTHLTRNIKCELCDNILPIDQDCVFNFIAHTHHPDNKPVSVLIYNQIESPIFSTAARGPPSI